MGTAISIILFTIAIGSTIVVYVTQKKQNEKLENRLKSLLKREKEIKQDVNSIYQKLEKNQKLNQVQISELRKDVIFWVDELEKEIASSKKPSKKETSKIKKPIDNLIIAYNEIRKDSSYASLAQVADKLIELKVVKDKGNAMKMVDTLSRNHPKAIRLGNIKGTAGNQLSIDINELSNGEEK